MPATALGPCTGADRLPTPEEEHRERIHGNPAITEESFANSGSAREIEVEQARFLREGSSGIAFRFPALADGERKGAVPGLCSLPKGEFANVDWKADARKGAIPAPAARMLFPSTREMPRMPKAPGSPPKGPGLSR
ncbi:protein of unknown function [Methylacidimicrobium sp. AP8]|uniref:hypothetical protein n=1 Tax=Methylacidimicrobium sp. AP8 TaxID=2730359 RepID=UPI0018C10074|nr:hypothetical protein [Methylacidimicrobium sp. AP8]CAB4242755.1 protein of unknown function [Methylacidimicrobium sp. AP8]